MIQQRTLRRLLDDSLADRCRGLADVTELAREADRSRPPVAALVLLRRFDLGEFVAGAAAFAEALDDDERRDWYRAFTRTLFLVGDPGRLPAWAADLLRHRSAHMAWAWTPGDGAGVGLRRLLKPLRTAGPPRVPALHRSGDGERELTVAVEGLTLERYLVHLHHALSESFITGELEPGEGLTLRHVPRIESLHPKPAYARVVPTADDPDRLEAAAYLSPSIARELAAA